MKHAYWLLFLGLATTLPAQQAAVPTVTTPWTSNNLPMAGGSMRYQQWFAPNEFVSTIGRPVRVTQLQLFGGPPGGQAGAFVDIEVTMANGPTGGPSFQMDSNLTNAAAAFPLAPVVVVPRGTGPVAGRHQLATAVDGAPVMTLPFQQAFVWDGSSGVVVDIKLFDNGKNNGNQPYTYNLQYTFRGAGKTTRLYAFSTNPQNVTTAAFVGNGEGISMVFDYVDGITVPFGSGCAGAGGFVPFASTSGGVPFGGNAAWAHTLANANSQQNALLIFGSSTATWGALPLPLDLTIIGGFGCLLWTDVQAFVATATVGGGPGAGSVFLPTPVPPVTLSGIEIFTQWMIFDTGAPQSVAMSQPLRHIFQ